MPTLPINGNRLYYVQAGSGDPVVLVHGSLTSHAVWQPIVERLSDSFSVFAYDRLGHNASARPAGLYCRSGHEDDLISLIEHFDRGPVQLVGNSYGAAICLGVAARRADLVRGVIAHEAPLIGLGASPRLDAVRATIQAAADRIEAGDAVGGTRAFVENVALGPGGWDLVPAPFRTMALGNADTFCAEIRDRRWADIDRECLAAYSGRVLLTEGSASPAWFSEVTDMLAAVIPHAERVTIEGAGHSPHSTQPEEYAQALRAYLGALV
jgi:pimeloyl-ACP methyl ester carboxylesterase